MTPNDPGQGQPTLSVPTALRWAWFWWAILLAAPFLFLQWLIWRFARGEVGQSHADAEKWFVAAIAYFVLVLPASFFWRRRLFKDYWLGRPVEPRRYIIATISVGLAIAVGGTFSLIGCFVTGSLMPNLIPALLALLLFVLHWPTGRAMVKPVGHADDPQVYEEPR